MALGTAVAGDKRAADGRRARVSGQFSRVTIDPVRGTASVTRVGDQSGEFPRIDDRLTGRPHRYLTVGTPSGSSVPRAGRSDTSVIGVVLFR